MKIKDNLEIGIGLLCWIIIAVILKPTHFFQISYVQILILAAPLWLIPMILQQLGHTNLQIGVWLITALLFAGAFLIPQGYWAACCALPYFYLTSKNALKYSWLLFKKQPMEPTTILEYFAHIFLPVGAVWGFADRLDYPLFGFDGTIVLLTVAHFHYAGFILLFLTSKIVYTLSKKMAKLVTIGLIFGVPLVAIGITTTHYGLPMFIETFAVSILAGTALLVGFFYLKFGLQNCTYSFGYLFMLSGLALVAGMSLALLYGWRAYFPVSYLSIPWMYAVHGTLNAVGFAIPGILGWAKLR